MRERIRAEEIVETIQGFEEKLDEFSLSFFILFGSVAREENSWWSDIDFVVHPIHKQNDKYQYLLGLIGVLEDLLETDKIQVNLWDDLPPHIKFRVLRDGINIIINDKREFQRIREKSLIEYWDHNIWYEKMLDMSLKNMDVGT